VEVFYLTMERTQGQAPECHVYSDEARTQEVDLEALDAALHSKPEDDPDGQASWNVLQKHFGGDAAAALSNYVTDRLAKVKRVQKASTLSNNHEEHVALSVCIESNKQAIADLADRQTRASEGAKVFMQGDRDDIIAQGQTICQLRAEFAERAGNAEKVIAGHVQKMENKMADLDEAMKSGDQGVQDERQRLILAWSAIHGVQIDVEMLKFQVNQPAEGE